MVRGRLESVTLQQPGIREAELRDRNGVWPLVRDFSTSFTPEEPAFSDAFATLVLDRNALVLVADPPGRGLCGYLLANRRTALLANGPVVWVEEVMVAEPERGSGLGRRLMEHAELWARSIDAPDLALASRPAGAFYLALGYDDAATFYKKESRQH